jgi:ABC-type phosphate/phosphonate transport system substrate-binding protein
MIGNARMYSVSAEAEQAWRGLLSAVSAHAGVALTLLEHAAPEPIEALWERTDPAAVFMCGLPFSQAAPQPALLAAPVPSPAEFAGEPRYWSVLVVREDSGHATVSDTFGGRIAFTVPGSQSGCVAALSYFMEVAGAREVAGDRLAARDVPLFKELIAPTVTPLGALTAVIEGAADVAPIDAYAFCLLERYRPDLARKVRILARTPPTAIPALVASARGAPDRAAALDALRAAFLEAARVASIKELMKPLLLQSFVRPDPAAYAALGDRYEATRRFWRTHALAEITHPAFAGLTPLYDA